MGVIGGLTMQIAFLHDLLCLLAMPLVVAYTAYAKLYAVHIADVAIDERQQVSLHCQAFLVQANCQVCA